MSVRILRPRSRVCGGGSVAMIQGEPGQVGNEAAFSHRVVCRRVADHRNLLIMVRATSVASEEGSGFASTSK